MDDEMSPGSRIESRADDRMDGMFAPAAASLMHVDLTTIKRYLRKGWLSRRDDGMINASEVQSLKQDIDICRSKDLGAVVREFFVLRAEGAGPEDIFGSYLGTPGLEQCLAAVDFYRKLRKTFFKGSGLDPDNHFMTCELMARLKVVHVGIFNDLNAAGVMDLVSVQTGNRLWHYIPVSSFARYMDDQDRRGQVLFTTAELSADTGIKVQTLDKRLQRRELGVKLNYRNRSIYLLTSSECCEVAGLGSYRRSK